ncbi:MAG: septum formation initiator family protein [Candidatus Moranbacteria bacterium]|nr:septum formation initiator family protein [Candidatus Moranbacteria bacterium]
MRESSDKGNSWLIRIIIFLGCVAVVFIFLAISRETYRKRQVQSEITKLQEEAKKIQGDNMRLSDKIAYLEGRDYQEKEIRDKLNLQDPKENVVIVDSGLLPKKTEGDPVPASQELLIKKSNPQKWWDYFFKY